MKAVRYTFLVNDPQCPEIRRWDLQVVLSARDEVKGVARLPPINVDITRLAFGRNGGLHRFFVGVHATTDSRLLSYSDVTSMRTSTTISIS